MPILGALLKQGIALRRAATWRTGTPAQQQRRVLKSLLTTAQLTDFGRHYHFETILAEFGTTLHRRDKRAAYRAFQHQVPLHNYNKIFTEWWHRTLKGEENVCWPGKTRYFALSSGTSEAATKHIPVTADMTSHMRRTGVRQILTLPDYDLSPALFTKGILMLGGSTQLSKVGYSYEGDLSGIQAKQIPFWFQPFYKPGKRIARQQDWAAKLEEMTEKAPQWDISVIVGVPAWMQLLMEKIIARYNLKTIHDIWPNLSIFTHGGVAFEPYKKGFEKLLARPLIYLETYLASEGFVAYQARPNVEGMKLVTDIGIFYEFIPFTDENFTTDGDPKPTAKTLTLDEVEAGRDYALLLTTCAGTWRYLIGDTVRFTDVKRTEIIITGRTKHFLSLCGEHLSVDNMNRALELAANEFGITVSEFAVAGVPVDTLFGHHWYVGTNDKLDAEAFGKAVDGHLKQLNDDYRIERQHALKEFKMNVLPSAIFYDFLRSLGKEGGQNKFPRVLKKTMLDSWRAFISKASL